MSQSHVSRQLTPEESQRITECIQNIETHPHFESSLQSIEGFLEGDETLASVIVRTTPLVTKLINLLQLKRSELGCFLAVKILSKLVAQSQSKKSYGPFLSADAIRELFTPHIQTQSPFLPFFTSIFLHIFASPETNTLREIFWALSLHEIIGREIHRSCMLSPDSGNSITNKPEAMNVTHLCRLLSEMYSHQQNQQELLSVIFPFVVPPLQFRLQNMHQTTSNDPLELTVLGSLALCVNDLITACAPAATMLIEDAKYHPLLGLLMIHAKTFFHGIQNVLTGSTLFLIYSIDAAVTAASSSSVGGSSSNGGEALLRNIESSTCPASPSIWCDEFAHFRKYVAFLPKSFHTIRHLHYKTDVVCGMMRNLQLLLFEAPPSFVDAYKFMLLHSHNAIHTLLLTLSSVDEELSTRSCGVLALILDQNSEAIHEFTTGNGVDLMHDILFDYSDGVLAAAFQLLCSIASNSVASRELLEKGVASRAVQIFVQFSDRITHENDAAAINQDFFRAMMPLAKFCSQLIIDPESPMLRTLVSTSLAIIDYALHSQIVSLLTLIPPVSRILELQFQHLHPEKRKELLQGKLQSILTTLLTRFSVMRKTDPTEYVEESYILPQVSWIRVVNIALQNAPELTQFEFFPREGENTTSLSYGELMTQQLVAFLQPNLLFHPSVATLRAMMWWLLEKLVEADIKSTFFASPIAASLLPLVYQFINQFVGDRQQKKMVLESSEDLKLIMSEELLHLFRVLQFSASKILAAAGSTTSDNADTCFLNCVHCVSASYISSSARSAAVQLLEIVAPKRGSIAQQLTPHIAKTILECESDEGESSTMLANNSFQLLRKIPHHSVPHLISIAFSALSFLQTNHANSGVSFDPLDPIQDADDAHDILVLITPLLNGVLHHSPECQEVALSTTISTSESSYLFVLSLFMQILQSQHPSIELALKAIILNSLNVLFSHSNISLAESAERETRTLYPQFYGCLEQLLVQSEECKDTFGEEGLLEIKEAVYYVLQRVVFLQRRSPAITDPNNQRHLFILAKFPVLVGMLFRDVVFSQVEVAMEFLFLILQNESDRAALAFLNQSDSVGGELNLVQVLQFLQSNNDITHMMKQQAEKHLTELFQQN